MSIHLFDRSEKLENKAKKTKEEKGTLKQAARGRLISELGLVKHHLLAGFFGTGGRD